MMTLSRNDSKLGAVALAATACVGIFILVVLHTMTPFPATNDHAYFLPASFALAEGERLANPWMPAGFNTALDWHGFLQPWLVGMGARLLGGGWANVYLALNLVAAATFFSAIHAGVRLRLGPWRVTAVALLTLALLLDSRSRPETLATLETIMLVFLFARSGARGLESPMRALVVGVVFAALLVTHPMIFGLSGIAFAAFVGVALIERDVAIRAVAIFAAIAGVAFGVCLLLLVTVCFGGSVAEWLTGIKRAAELTTGRSDSEGFLHFYAANRFLPGIGVGLVFIPLIAIGAWFRPRDLSSRRWLGALLICGVTMLFAFFLWWFAIRIPPTYYNYAGLLVAGALLASVLTAGKGLIRIVSDGALGLLALSALGGIALLAAQSFTDRNAFLETRASLAKAIAADASHGMRICADTAALPALDDPKLAHRVVASIPFAGTPAPPDPKSCDVFYALQTRGVEGAPTQMAGFKPEENDTLPPEWTRARPFHLGFVRFVRESRSKLESLLDEPNKRGRVSIATHR